MPDAYALALKALTTRELSAQELHSKLLKLGCSEADAAQALAECQRQGYQSDERYVDAYCRMRICAGDGPLKIEQFLRGKGIDSVLIQQRLDEECWLTQARKVWEKKYLGVEQSDAYRMKAKQQRFMLSRGFSSGVIQELLNTV